MKLSFKQMKKKAGTKRANIWILLLVGATFFSSCEKILDVHSKHAVDEENFWNSHIDTRAALIGVYGLMRAALANNDAFWMYGDLRDGDFVSLQRPDLRAIIKGNLKAPYSLLDQLSNWRRFYAVINASNMFLEHVDEVNKKDPKYSEQNMRVDIAQIRCLRAFAYFYMTRIWGDVPLITASYDGDFPKIGRDSQDSVLAFCERELTAAAEYLPYLYSSDDPLQQGQYYNEGAGRWNGALVRRLSALSVLAHVEAWQGKDSAVASVTKFILDNFEEGGHAYITSTENLTKSDGFFAGIKTNHILAFSFLWANSDASFSGHLEELTLAEPLTDKSLPDIYVPKDSIIAIFNINNDERFSVDTLTGLPTSDYYFTNFSSSIPIFSKIKVLQGGGTPDPDFRIYGSAIVFTRLEDIALLRAVALLRLGDRSGAISLLNRIRDMREVRNYDEALDGDLLHAIFKERRKELMGEGWRWFDLIRYNKIKQNDPAFMKLIREGGIYWPVSETILQQNPRIQQNPYWK